MCCLCSCFLFSHTASFIFYTNREHHPSHTQQRSRQDERLQRRVRILDGERRRSELQRLLPTAE